VNLVPRPEEIKAARAVLTDKRIMEIGLGFVPVETVITRMLEAAEKVRAQAQAKSPASNPAKRPVLTLAKRST
jgi:hypothetical protein